MINALLLPLAVALAAIDCDPADTVMIGDDVVGDVVGAQHAGLEGMLVKTGKFREADLQSSTRPFDVLDSIADLPDWWK